MDKMTLLDLISQNKTITKWLKTINQSKRQLLMGLSGSVKALVMAKAYEEQTGKLVIVTATQHQAEQLIDNLSTVIEDTEIYHFFADDVPAAEFIFSSLDRASSRLESLKFLLDKNKKGILVTSIVGLRVLLPSPKQFKEAIISLTVGEEKNPKALVDQLHQMGYDRVSQVLNPGEFSQRGDILDVYDITQSFPYRLEFFGDEIDGIRQFDSETQKSLDVIEKVVINPADDVLLTKEDYLRATSKIEKAMTVANQDQKQFLEAFLSDTKHFHKAERVRQFLSLFYEKEWTLRDYFPKGTLVFFDDFQKINEQNTRITLEVAQLLTDDLQKHQSLSTMSYFADHFQDFKKYQPATFFTAIQRGLGNLTFDALYQFNQYPIQEFFNQLPLLVDEIKRYQKQEVTVIIQSSTKKELLRLQETLREYGLDIAIASKNQIEPSRVQLLQASLSNGFYFADEKLVFITEKEIFHKKVKRQRRTTQMTNAERLKNYNDLEKGDYVVHHVHGIGRFLGIETIEVSGVHKDYITIQYRNSDRISIPVEQINLISKYLASDGKEPKINKLNDGRFQRTKQRVSKQVEDIADDLINLYAKRSQLKGFAFSPDDDSQKEFEEDFPFVETPDQLRSIKEVKKDMESSQPMDRLLVGDVGFGKTEVAMRAAFKAVNDGKQVAILVPTTVLAQQHYQNFKERFESFPVTVDIVSRFKTKKEQELTLDKLKKGQVDILIGTHRLLSDDVQFSDLGLIVIDEEQRFGVKHKEKLKQLKAKVDVLTLTATPIPRTLHMSMLGIRDLSLIETPPTNRYPVQTYVMPSTPDIIREAILREIDRGGQIYYVYNRVESIEKKVSELKELVPEANIGFVHGQMSDIQLENTLFSFIEGQYDVLVATTIIETGVDISNVNTLFVENADYMGLSTLYQLRGRVGRSSRLAYAYLMYHPDKILTEVSEKRLEAIKGFTELGSGFKIAMRDLAIRGAGNILGASQSGFIDSVGFEMYSQLLEEAIARKQGQLPERQKGNAEIDFKIDAYLSNDYINDERQKIEIYKRIREIDSQDNYQELQEEIIDRFGDYPDQVAYLLEIGLIKNYMDKAFVEYVQKNNGYLTIRFEKKSLAIYLTQDYFEAISKTQLKARISEHQGKIEIIFDIRNKKDYVVLEALKQFGEALDDIKKRKT
ncbi:transcription-repair coupling factor [Streptococcus pacificus]|uniref:Transcription-repair-coupling factor n=1 Tax=Streptococcus pacificus TaxID=2740577 RepID=A0ABS0ZK03_9STRE|nr:transcription-repair coupling factor [Streptococcus pacificus]MBJ8326350.1 transcription-repair coupling factor [Streptococcus pacificus]